MGLYEDHLEFGVEPPSEAALVERLREATGDVTGLENYSVQGRRAVLNCMLDPYTRPYALKFLMERGGALVDRRTRLPISVNLPWYVQEPWRGLPWWRRLAITMRYHCGPRRRRS